MKKTIILYHPKTSHERNYSFFWIPYSVLSLAGGLRRKGYEVIIIDANLENCPTDINYREVLFVGISVMIGQQITDGLNYAKQIKNICNVTIVWGGPFPTLLPELVLKEYLIDYIIRGPGEKAIVDLADALFNKAKIDDSIGRRYESAIRVGNIQSLAHERDIDEYDYKLIDLKKYIRNDPNISDKVINYISSRGCCYDCGFCTESAIYHKHWIAFSPERIVFEVNQLLEMSGANAIKFYDANFFVNPKRVFDYLEKLYLLRGHVNFAASAHPQNILDLSNKQLSLLRERGLKRLLIGLESGVQAEIDFIRKDFQIQNTYKLAEDLEKAGIIGSFTFITGYPSMPMSNIDKTLDFVKELSERFRCHEYKTHLYMPYPGTRLYALAKQYGFQEPVNLEEWAQFDYYQIQMPWVNTNYQIKIDELNSTLCPYVHL